MTIVPHRFRCFRLHLSLPPLCPKFPYLPFRLLFISRFPALLSLFSLNHSFIFFGWSCPHFLLLCPTCLPIILRPLRSTPLALQRKPFMRNCFRPSFLFCTFPLFRYCNFRTSDPPSCLPSPYSCRVGRIYSSSYFIPFLFFPPPSSQYHYACTECPLFHLLPRLSSLLFTIRHFPFFWYFFFPGCQVKR